MLTWEVGSSRDPSVEAERSLMRFLEASDERKALDGTVQTRLDGISSMQGSFGLPLIQPSRGELMMRTCVPSASI